MTEISMNKRYEVLLAGRWFPCSSGRREPGGGQDYCLVNGGGGSVPPGQWQIVDVRDDWTRQMFEKEYFRP
jgi:hypothetical protein